MAAGGVIHSCENDSPMKHYGGFGGAPPAWCVPAFMDTINRQDFVTTCHPAPPHDRHLGKSFTACSEPTGLVPPMAGQEKAEAHDFRETNRVGLDA